MGARTMKKVEIQLSTFGLRDVIVDGELLHQEIPLIMAQALAYCLEHDLDSGWSVEEGLNHYDQ
jgi:hypothetical protein